MRRALLALALCQACAVSELTEVIVVIAAESRVRMRSESLFLRVSAADGATLLENSNAPWTNGRYTLGLAPKGDANRYTVEARALQDGVAIAQARLISGFVEGQTRYVRLLLEDACVGMLSCDDETTCRAGDCVAADADPEEFSTDRDQAPTSTTLAPTSEVKDAGNDARPSASKDAGAPRDANAPGDASVQDARIDEVDASAQDAATPSETDAGLAAPPDAGLPSLGGGTGGLPKCSAGYYEGTWSGDYAYTGLGFETNAKILATSTVSAPVLSLLLEVDGPSSLRIAKGCVSSTMQVQPANRAFLARLGGTLSCTTGVLQGTLVGHYIAGIKYPFSGSHTARLSGNALVDGAWTAEEPTTGSASGGGEGVWSATWKGQTAPSGLDPCADVAPL